GEQLLRQRGGAKPRLLNLFERWALAIPRSSLRKEQLGYAENRRPHGDEIGRDSAGKAPDALHLPEVRQPLLRHTPLGRFALDAHVRLLRADIRGNTGISSSTTRRNGRAVMDVGSGLTLVHPSVSCRPILL